MKAWRRLPSVVVAVAVAMVAVAVTAPGASAQERSRPLAPSAREVLAHCVQQADAQLRGLQDLSAACPGLEAALHDLDIEGVLPERWREHVSARALSDWGALVDRYSHERNDGAAAGALLLEPARLQAIARSLPQRAIAQNPWIWVRAWLMQHRELWASLRRFLSSWRGSDTLGGVLNGFLVLVLVGVVAGAAVIVHRELRAAGVLGRSKEPRPRRPADTPVLAPQEAALDLKSAPPHLRPVLLLRMLVAALSRAQQLDHERVLTCRELVTSARFETPLQRERFAALTVLAERGLYGDPRRELPPEQDAVLAAAAGLVEQIVAAPRAAGATR